MDVEVEVEVVELGAYLRVLRNRLDPDDFGVSDGGRRRVSGLRRQEIADLAGISLQYYLRLEQGRDRRPSPQVLDALARALRLDSDGHAYLYKLAQQAVAQPQRVSGTGGAGAALSTTAAAQVGNLTNMVTSWTNTPAYVVDKNFDIIAVNELGQLFLPLRSSAGTNLIEAAVEGASEADATERVHWDQAVGQLTAALRFQADPADERLQFLVASLSSRSTAFRRAWASHDARPLREGSSPVHIEPFGYIEFHWQTLEVHGGDHFLTSFFGPPDSPAAAAVEFVRARLRVEERIRENAIIEE